MNTANLTESDSVAIFRTGNAISNLPVYLDANNTSFVKMEGVWCAVSELKLKNFERYETRRKKKLYDTARNRMVEV